MHDVCVVTVGWKCASEVLLLDDGESGPCTDVWMSLGPGKVGGACQRTRIACIVLLACIANKYNNLT